MEEKNVVRNIIKIRMENGFTKRKVADGLGISEASYGRIEGEKIALSYKMLAQIASLFGMSVIDVLTYPDVFVKSGEDSRRGTKVTLQVEIEKEDIKADVIKLAFGDRVLEVRNK